MKETGEYEAWALSELSSVSSPINVGGQALVQRLDAFNLCFYQHFDPVRVRHAVPERHLLLSEVDRYRTWPVPSRRCSSVARRPVSRCRLARSVQVVRERATGRRCAAIGARRLAIGILLLTAFLCVLVFAGHGVGPVGLLLVLGRAPEYAFPMVTGWLGIAGVLVSLLSPSGTVGRFAAVAGIMLVALSWAGFLWVSERRIASVLTSVPLMVAMALFARAQLWGGSRSDGSGEDSVIVRNDPPVR